MFTIIFKTHLLVVSAICHRFSVWHIETIKRFLTWVVLLHKWACGSLLTRCHGYTLSQYVFEMLNRLRAFSNSPLKIVILFRFYAFSPIPNSRVLKRKLCCFYMRAYFTMRNEVPQWNFECRGRKCFYFSVKYSINVYCNLYCLMFYKYIF